MKSLLRNFFINLSALWATAYFLPAFSISEGIKGYLLGALFFMIANLSLVPLLKLLLLPLNLLTLGLFTWVGNILALYLLVTNIPSFSVHPYLFPGVNLNGFIIPPAPLSSFHVAILASFMIGLIIHSLSWLLK